MTLDGITSKRAAGLALMAIGWLACREAPAPAGPASGTASSGGRTGGAPASGAAGQPAVAAGLKFIENDYSAALAEAKTRHVPIFVEAWAPW